MEFLIIIALSYVFYRKGKTYLLKSKMLMSEKVEQKAYILLMLSGVIIGEYLSITYIPHLYSLSNWSLIFATTLISILLGEIVYNRNYRLIQRIIISEKK